MGEVVSKEQNVFENQQMDVANEINKNRIELGYAGFLKLPAFPKWVKIGPNGGLYYMSTRDPSKKNYFSKKMYRLLLEGQLPHCISNCSIEEIVKNMPNTDKDKWSISKYKQFINNKLQQD